MDLFLRHRWPGNLRQLSNALRTAALMAGDADEIDIGHLPEDLFDEGLPTAGDAVPGASARDAEPSPSVRSAAHRPAPAAVRSWDETVEDALRHALSVHGGNVSAVARALGVSRNTVYRRLKSMDGTAAHH